VLLLRLEEERRAEAEKAKARAERARELAREGKLAEALASLPAQAQEGPLAQARQELLRIAHRVVGNAVFRAREALAGCAVRVASVAAGFPAAQTPFRVRLLEVEEAARAGADEVDVVVSRAHVLWGDWRALYEEVRAFREAAGSCHLKTILGTGELPTLRHVAQAALVCMMAGADFVKTSTGKEAVNATLPVGLVMVRQVRDYHARTGYRVGFKPAGGIRTAKQALEWLALVREELGESWTRPETFRIGASSLLTDLERQLSYHLTGRYSAAHHHPMP
jgi:deoxyribose-phosphate aldolase